MPDSVQGDRRTFVLHLVFQARAPSEIERWAEVASDPSSPEFGRHLTREEFAALAVLPEGERRLVAEWLLGHGMEISQDTKAADRAIYARATLDQLETAFGKDVIDRMVGDDVDARSSRSVLTMPRHLAGYVHDINVLPDPTRLFGVRPPADRANAVVHAHPASGTPPTELAGLTPRDVTRIYEFPDEWDGRGETIALMMLGGMLDESDLHRFCSAHGITAPTVRTVHVGPKTGKVGGHPLFDLEVAMAVEWAGAMAPGARLAVYFVDPAVIDDPWTAFLSAVLWEDEDEPAIACTSWITPERKYYQRHGHRRVASLLSEAAALGVTVISASGDWGAFDGVPRTTAGGEFVSDAPWPHAVFPAVEERVLSVGGTMITSRDPFTEVGWSGPPPPGLTKVLHFDRIASSGGFSEEVPIPAWQRPVFRPYYPRGASSPSVIPHGRGFPDVALAAAGPAVHRADDASLSSQGYQAVAGGRWVDFAGGTSVAAPIWAAIMARVNQARREAGRGRAGFVNPTFYGLLHEEPCPFRTIQIGEADVAMKVVDYHGRPATFELAGYDSVPGWDPVTGLGVPRVRRLIELLANG